MTSSVVRTTSASRRNFEQAPLASTRREGASLPVYLSSATVKVRGKMLTPEQRREKIRTVFRVASGNFLEMYDFMIFGYFSAAIGRAYFPASSEFASLMFSMTTFAVGFMVRPLGAIFLGAYID